MKFTTLAVLLLSAATTTLAAPAVPNPALGPSPDYCSYGCKVRRAFGFETPPVLVKEAVSVLTPLSLPPCYCSLHISRRFGHISSPPPVSRQASSNSNGKWIDS
jgi:hypothetical protein